MLGRISWPWVRKWSLKVLRYVIIYAAAIIILFPIYWMMMTSFKSLPEVILPTLLPRQPGLHSYQWVLTQTPFLTNLRNSIIVSSMVVLVSITLSLLGAYSMARFRYPGRQLLSQLVLFAYIVPAILLLVPIFMTVRDLGLLNKLPGLVVADTAFVLPFCLWLLRGFIAGIPVEIEEAALIDGCTKLRAFRHVLLPLTAPGVVAAAMFAWVLSWNEYLFALTFIRSDNLKTLPIRLAWYLSPNVGYERWGPMVAEAVLFMLPGLAVYAFLQRYLVEGLSAGAVK